MLNLRRAGRFQLCSNVRLGFTNYKLRFKTSTESCVSTLSTRAAFTSALAWDCTSTRLGVKMKPNFALREDWPSSIVKRHEALREIICSVHLLLFFYQHFEFVTSIILLFIIYSLFLCFNFTSLIYQNFHCPSFDSSFPPLSIFLLSA
jgi:hypothetical protein